MSGYDSGNSDWSYVDDYLSSFTGGGSGDYADYFKSDFYYPDPHIGGRPAGGGGGGAPQVVGMALADFATA